MRWTRLIPCIASVAVVAQAAEPTWQQLQCIPGWAAAALENKAFASKYALSNRLNPFILQGDFDGDGRTDLAVLVAERNRGAAGIAIVHAPGDAPRVVGAGTSLGAGGADFSWLDGWSVEPKGPVGQGADPAPPPTLHGDALLVKKLEASSALVYWDGAAYRWYQQGD
jgi:hypothetical protein